MNNTHKIVSIEEIEQSPNKKLDYEFDDIIEDIPTEGNIKANLNLESLGDFIKVTGNVKLIAKLECDICLNEYEENMDFDIEEEFKMTTIGKSNLSATKTYTLLPNFEGKSITYAKSWLSSYGISVEVEEQESTKTAGTIISQSLPASKRIDLINGSIKFVVAKESSPIIDIPNIPSDDNEENNETEDNTETSETPDEETPSEPTNP